jgi:sterol 14-demethylase
MTTAIVPRVSGGQQEHGHLEEFRSDPIGLMRRVRDECGDVGWFELADKHVILLSGSRANEFFFRSADEDLDQAQAYPFMTPIFGAGVVFDASPERRKEMLHNAALRGEQMKGHAVTIEREVRRMIAGWGEQGEVDLLDFFAELTIYTSTACLIGVKFREQLDARFAHRPPTGRQERPRHARRAGVDQGRAGQSAVHCQRGHRHVHLDDVRRAPH